jgi:hypothetical protein
MPVGELRVGPGLACVVGLFGVWRALLAPCRRVGRVFQGLGSFVVVGAGRSAGQGKAARMRCQAVAIAAAQRQVASMRSRSCRAPRIKRAATCSTR